MEKYIELVKSINISIKSFNNYLNEKYSIEEIDENKINDSNYFNNFLNYEEETWVNNKHKGVYFCFGHEIGKNENLGIYIGKASIGEEHIGRRLHNYFNHQKSNEYFIMPGTDYKIELVTSISLEQKEISFMSSAFEEFLIADLQEKHFLLNSTGNN